jgi:hypothetical protein
VIKKKIAEWSIRMAIYMITILRIENKNKQLNMTPQSKDALGMKVEMLKEVE